MSRHPADHRVGAAGQDLTDGERFPRDAVAVAFEGADTQLDPEHAEDLERASTADLERCAPAGAASTSRVPGGLRRDSGGKVAGTASDTAAIGVLERYELLDELGRGGFGIVYKAKQLTTGQLVAIKLLITDQAPSLKARDEMIARFRREMGLIARLHDPNTVRLLDSGVSDEGQPFLVLEYVEGRELAAVLAEDGPLEPWLAKKLMMQVLQSVAEAHEHGIVHRDLKPENIMVQGRGQRTSAKVLDFGIAGIQNEHKEATDEGITVAGMTRGTPNYMAPEQLQLFGEARPETDVYALGLITLECLTGKKAVTAESLPLICLKQVKEDVEIPAAIMAGPFGPIIRTACQKDPDARFASAEELLDVMACVDVETGTLSGLETSAAWEKIRAATASITTVPSVATGQPETASPAPTAARRGRWGLIVVVLGVAVIGAAAALLVLQRHRGGPSPSVETPPVTAAGAVEAGRPGRAATASAAQAGGVGAAYRAVDPNEALLLDALARARQARRELRYEDALVAYDEALRLRPDHYEALKGKGWSLVDLNRFAEAVEWLVRALEVAPDTAVGDEELYLTLAVAYEGSGAIDEAVATYDRFLARFPESAKASIVRMQKLDIERQQADPPRKTTRRRRASAAPALVAPDPSGVKRPPKFE